MTENNLTDGNLKSFVLRLAPVDYSVSLSIGIVIYFITAAAIRASDRWYVGMSCLLFILAASIVINEIAPRLLHWEVTKSGLFRCTRSRFGHPEKRRTLLFLWEEVESVVPRKINWCLAYRTRITLKDGKFPFKHVDLPMTDRTAQLLDLFETMGIPRKMR